MSIDALTRQSASRHTCRIVLAQPMDGGGGNFDGPAIVLLSDSIW